MTLGFTSDRLSTPQGYATFLTFTRSLPGGISPFASLKYADAEDRVYFPFGANVVLRPDLTFQAIYDGDFTHLLLTRRHESQSVTLILARTRQIGVSWSFGL